jgi:hypothetical protein
MASGQVSPISTASNLCDCSLTAFNQSFWREGCEIKLSRTYYEKFMKRLTI